MLVNYIAIALFILIAIAAFVDFKKVVIIWLPAQLLFNAQVAVRYSPPAMSLVIAVDLYLLLFYYVFRKKLRKDLNHEKFFMVAPMILLLVSYVMSSVFGVIQTTKGITSTIKYFASGFGVVFLSLRVLNTSKDIQLFLRTSVIVFCIAVSLAISENVLKDNLWLDFIYFNSPQDDSTVGRMFYTPPMLGNGLEIRYGMVRARACFGIHIAFGFACAMYLWLFLLMMRNKWPYLPNRITKAMAVILLGGVLMANAKTGYIGLCVFCLGLFSLSDIFNFRIILGLMLVFVIICIYVPNYLNNILSLFDSDLAEEGGGSTVAGREVQFKAALNMFYMNPLFGNGPGAIGVLSKIGNNGAILGAESSWMQILPERGVLGIIAYLYLYISLFKQLRYKLPVKVLAFFLLSIFVMETATGMLEMYVWCVVLVVAKRMYQLKQYGYIYK